MIKEVILISNNTTYWESQISLFPTQIRLVLCENFLRLSKSYT